MQCWYWCCHQCNMMPTLISHDQNGHDAPCFIHLDLNKQNDVIDCHRYCVMLALVSTASLHQKESCHTLFQLLHIPEQNGAIDDTVSITWQQCWCQRHHMTEKSSLTSFWPLWPNECNGAIDKSIEIIKICLDIGLTCLEIVWVCLNA